MPWHLGSADSCPSDRPVAVIKTSDGSVAGCHSNRESANAQMAALYANAPDARCLCCAGDPCTCGPDCSCNCMREDEIGHQPSGVKTDLPDGTVDDPPPYVVPSGQVAIGNQTPWTKSPIMHTTPSTQIW